MGVRAGERFARTPYLLGLALCAVLLAAIAGAAAGEFGPAFWRAVGSAFVVSCAGFVLDAARRLGLPLGAALLALAPATATLLLVGLWRDTAGRLFVQVLLTATALTLAAFVVGSLKLLGGGRGSGAVISRAAAALALATAVLALVLTWSERTRESAVQALVGLSGAVVVLYAASVGAARLSGPPST